MKTKQFTFRTDDDFLAFLDDWRVTRRPVPGRAEALRQLAYIGAAASAPVQAEPKAKTETPRDPRQADLVDYLAAPAVEASAKAEEAPAAAPARVLRARRAKVVSKPVRGRKPATKKTPSQIRREALKKQLTGHEGWTVYRKERGLKIEDMSWVQCLEAADGLGLQAAA